MRLVERLRDAPIGRKLLAIGLLTTAVALALASIALIVRGALEWRTRTVADLETYASMIGANAAPAVMFDDASAAADTLAALAAKPSIVYAAIRDPQGRVFAEYGHALDPAELRPGAGPAFSARSIALAAPLRFKDDQLGTLLLQSDLREMYGNLARDAGLIVLAALVAFSAGTVLLLRLQKTIVQPIRQLADAMQGVSDQRDYAVRVPVVGRDEVAVLSQTFNTMLEHIQGRDAELALHRDRLEAEVARRTAQLRDANERLEQELQERRRAEAALQRSSEQVRLLSDMAATLQTCLSQDEVGPVTGPFLARLLPESSGAIYLMKNSRNLVELAAGWGASPAEPQVFAPTECWAVRRGQLHVTNPGLTAPRCGHAGGDMLSCAACAPMMAHGEMLGLIHASCTPERLGTVEQAVLQRVAGEVAQALAGLRNRDALKRMAIRDPLTGLFNRRYLEEYLGMEIVRSARKNTQLGLLLIDIDHFKEFNDSFGHDAGDEVLREVGSLFMRHIRDGDAACRYGGEEFVLAMWDCSLEAARLRAEQLRADVKKLQLRFGQTALRGVTLSVGVAVFPDHGTSADEVLRAADRALYTAKLAGRDCVSLAGQPAAIPSAG